VLAQLFMGVPDKCVSARSRREVTELTALLSQRELAFVVCINPNSNLKPRVFDRVHVFNQLRALGVLDTIAFNRSLDPV
jgi:myosin heavy subunit